MRVVKVTHKVSALRSYLGQGLSFICFMAFMAFMALAIGVPSPDIETKGAWVSDSTGGFIYVLNENPTSSATKDTSSSTDDPNIKTYRVSYDKPILKKEDSGLYSVEIARTSVDAESLPSGTVSLDPNIDGAISTIEIADGLIIPVDSVEIPIPKGKELESITISPGLPVSISGEYALRSTTNETSDIVPSIPAGKVGYSVREDSGIESIDLYPVDYAPKEHIVSYRPFIDIKVKVRDISSASYSTSIDAINESLERIPTWMASFVPSFHNLQNVTDVSIDSDDVAQNNAHAVSNRIQTRSAQSIPSEYYNGIEVKPGSRALNGVGEFRYRNTNIRFIARGAVYTKVTNDPETYNSTFEIGSYDNSESGPVALALNDMQNSGYNTVRVLIDCGSYVRAFIPNRNGVAGSWNSTTLDSAYMNNVADFVKKAHARGLYVIFGLSFAPINIHYAGSISIPSNPGSPIPESGNAYYMNQTAINAKKNYLQDFITTLQSKLTSTQMRTILTYVLHEELILLNNLGPFSSTSGTLLAADVATGKNYNMGDKDERQQAADDNILNWANVLADAVKAKDPLAMTSVSLMPYRLLGKIDGPMSAKHKGLYPVNDTTYSFASPWFPARAPVLSRSGIDFVSMHPYPYQDHKPQSWLAFNPVYDKYSVDEDFASFEFANTYGPVMLDEFGAGKYEYDSIEKAASGMADFQASTCKYGKLGWIFWTYDAHPTQPDFLSLKQNGGTIDKILAPVFRPDPCSNSNSSSHTLTVTKNGDGSGTVAGGGISCGTTCSKSYSPGTQVALTATPDTGKTFSGWSGGGCSGTGNCSVIMNSGNIVSATFTTAQGDVNIAKNKTVGSLSNPADVKNAVDGDYDTEWNAGKVAPQSFYIDLESSHTMTKFKLTMSYYSKVSGTAITQIWVKGPNASDVAVMIKTFSVDNPSASQVLEYTLPTPNTNVRYVAIVTTSSPSWVAWKEIEIYGRSNSILKSMGMPLLTVAKAGAGSGIVTSNTAGINCGDTCKANFNLGTLVTLTASPSAGSSFHGWSGAGCSGIGHCVITFSSALNVTATFTKGSQKQYSLKISKSGKGSGTVTSSPDGISCGTTCSFSYDKGTFITLTAVPDDSESVFMGWKGACSGKELTCHLTLSKTKSVKATFEKKRYPLTLTAVGSGKVSYPKGGIKKSRCGLACEGDINTGFWYLPSTELTLKARLGRGDRLDNWGDACSGTDKTCVITMSSSARSVTVTFIKQYLLKVSKSGKSNLGVVSSSPNGINCDATCNKTVSSLYDTGTTVTLTATPVTGGVFMAWKGACVGTESTCTVAITKAKSVTATFAASPN